MISLCIVFTIAHSIHRYPVLGISEVVAFRFSRLYAKATAIQSDNRRVAEVRQEVPLDNAANGSHETYTLFGFVDDSGNAKK